VDAGIPARLCIALRTCGYGRLNFGLTIFNSEDIGIFSAISSDTAEYIPEDTQMIFLDVPTALLHAGSYRVEGALVDNGKIVEQNDSYCSFTVFRQTSFDIGQQKSKGLLRFPGDWIFQKEHEYQIEVAH
jgi:hypothetical protein